MPTTFTTSRKKTRNLFASRDPTYNNIGPGSGVRPDRSRFRMGNEKSIIAAVYTKIAIDVASTTIQHVRVNDDEMYEETIDSGLNRCLNLEANIDQTGYNLKIDTVISMFDDGYIALAPIWKDDEIKDHKSEDILGLRVAAITDWFPSNVRLHLYNEETGLYEDVTVPKSEVAIIENPFYNMMNEPQSIVRRLIRKLNLLDVIDEQSGSGKIDIIVQVPYSLKHESKREYAEQRRKDIEVQLTGSKYGVAYADSTEKITQLNRPVENNLMTQIEYLTRMLYGQLGMSEAVFDGTATNEVMTNYYSRTVEPILTVIVSELKRKFLSKNAIADKQSVMYFRDPFKFIPITALAEITDKFTRNAVFTPNDVRRLVGFKPSKDPDANTLKNRNIADPKAAGAPKGEDKKPSEVEENSQE